VEPQLRDEWPRPAALGAGAALLWALASQRWLRAEAQACVQDTPQ